MNDIENGWIGSEDRESYEEIEPAHICAWCGEDIFEGDEYYDFEGDSVCFECINKCLKIA